MPELDHKNTADMDGRRVARADSGTFASIQNFHVFNLVNILDNLVNILFLYMLDVQTHINVDRLPPVSSIRVHL
jgi:hypothetical protein